MSTLLFKLACWHWSIIEWICFKKEKPCLWLEWRWISSKDVRGHSWSPTRYCSNYPNNSGKSLNSSSLWLVCLSPRCIIPLSVLCLLLSLFLSLPFSLSVSTNWCVYSLTCFYVGPSFLLQNESLSLQHIVGLLVQTPNISSVSVFLLRFPRRENLIDGIGSGI